MARLQRTKHALCLILVNLDDDWTVEEMTENLLTYFEEYKSLTKTTDLAFQILEQPEKSLDVFEETLKKFFPANKHLTDKNCIQGALVQFGEKTLYKVCVHKFFQPN